LIKDPALSIPLGYGRKFGLLPLRHNCIAPYSSPFKLIIWAESYHKKGGKMKTFTEKYWASMLLLFAVVFFLSVLILLLQGILDPKTAYARDLRSIYVYGNLDNGKKDIAVEPSKTMVEPHTTAVWYNKSDSDIKLIFLEGKACKESTKATLGWCIAEA
jgi:hypothetical protein